jgi:hypothetical protein
VHTRSVLGFEELARGGNTIVYLLKKSKALLETQHILNGYTEIFEGSTSSRMKELLVKPAH